MITAFIVSGLKFWVSSPVTNWVQYVVIQVSDYVCLDESTWIWICSSHKTSPSPTDRPFSISFPQLQCSPSASTCGVLVFVSSFVPLQFTFILLPWISLLTVLYWLFMSSTQDSLSDLSTVFITILLSCNWHAIIDLFGVFEQIMLFFMILVLKNVFSTLFPLAPSPPHTHASSHIAT